MRVRLKSGLSPIIATIILILIATSAGVLLWLWVSSYVSRSPTAPSALNERVKIEAVSLQSESVRVYVRNIGDIPLNVSSAYVLDVNGNYVAGGPIESVMIYPGEVKSVVIPCDKKSLTPNNVYVVKVVTQRGVESLNTFVVSS